MSHDSPVVTRLTVARLFNLGNYEHERIEVEVRARGVEGDPIPSSIRNPSAVVAEVRAALEACKPVEKPHDLERCEEVESGLLPIAKEGEEPSEEDRYDWVSERQAKELLESLADYRAALARREAALLGLDKLGEVTVTKGGAS